jgi:hypothetical protein
MAHLGLDRASAPRFVILEVTAKTGDFAGTQSIDRKMVASLAISRDLILAQQFRHGFLRYACNFYRWPAANA